MHKSKFKKHIPFHLFRDKEIYFVTARTLKAKKLFNNDKKLNIIAIRLNRAIKEFNLVIHAWVVLANHYHIMFTLDKGKQLSGLIKFINGGSAYELNKLDKKKGRQAWWNYWDKCIRDEAGFYKRFNYIHHNPVKHGYSATNGSYKFSSYNYYKNKLDKEFLNDAEYAYPITDYTGVEDVE